METERGSTFLRAWRKHRGLSIEDAAARVDTTGATLSRIERGIQPYNQDLLEKLAALYSCDVAELLARDPEAGQQIWSIWDHATRQQREQIVSVAEALVSYRAGGKR